MEKDLLFAQLRDMIIAGDADGAAVLSRRTLEIGIPPLETIDKVVTPTLRQVGDHFSTGEAFLPDLIFAGRVATTILDVLNAGGEAGGGNRICVATIVIGTVEGDIHSIGKDIVASLYKANGFKVVDLGVNVPAAEFVRAVRENTPDLLGLSALMTTTMLKQAEVIKRLQEEGLRDKVKIIVGGAPVSPDWAEHIGADGAAADAVRGISLSKSLLNIAN